MIWALQKISFFWEFSFPERSDGDYGMDSTATRCTTLDLGEENRKIEEEKDGPDQVI